MSNSYNFPSPLATSRHEIIWRKNTQTYCVFSLQRFARLAARKSGAGRLVQHCQRVWLPNQCRVEVEVKIEPAVGLRVVNGPRHQNVSRIMITFRLDQARVEFCQPGVNGFQFAGEDLKFFTTAPLNERAADEMINHLVPLAIAHGLHQTGNPWARIRLAERNAAPLQQIEHELKML